MIVTSEVNLGQLLITLVLSLLGWGLRRGHRAIIGHLRRINSIDDRLEVVAERVDEHGDILIKAGWMKGGVWKPVSHRRRESDKGVSL